MRYPIQKLAVVALVVPFMLAAGVANQNSGKSSRYLDFGDVPETVPAISTSIKSLMYTDVTNQVTMIESPEPNQFGSAILEHPIKLPPGRQGMAPDVTLIYNSDQSSSWMGQGWNISVPLIEVETRWGAPRYDGSNESETYLLDGNQLAPVAHRGALVPREADRTFSLRSENAFLQVIRHGNSPKNYWWEVTTKDGLISYYGGLPDLGPVSFHTLKDNSGNIAQWHITRQVDRNGNTINYNYATVSDAGVSSSSVLGQNIYPESIYYTGYEEANGPFAVKFILDDGERRRDVEIDCKQGFKKVTADLLGQIVVEYNGDLVRRYDLNYEEGAFHKTLLMGIEEYDANGELFYDHSFEYYDDVRVDGEYRPYFAEQVWAVQDDDIGVPILNPIEGVDVNTSVLGAAGSTGFSVGSALTVGPNDFLLFSKINTIGGNYEHSSSNGNGLTALVDIDGDGLPDKLYKTGDELRYRKNLSAQGTFGFSEERIVTGARDFNVFKSRSRAIGGEAHPGGVFIGYTNTKTTNTISTYLSDFNGDGLIDIANNGSVLFNSIDSEGRPVFSSSSANTPSPISAGGGISDDLVTVDPQVFEDLVDESPLHDIVRFWEAPEDGTVNITGGARLIEDNSQAASLYGKQDGVNITIEHLETTLWERRINWGDFSEFVPSGLTNINVDAGDRIYFRVQSVFDGAYDQVVWNPTVEYNNRPDDVDANGKSLFSFTACEDFTLSSCQSVNLSVDGEISITGNLNKPVTSADIWVEVMRTDTFDNTDVIFVDTIAWDSAGVFPVEASDLPVTFGDKLEFKVGAFSNVDWSEILWIPRMFYTESYVDTIDVIDAQGNPLIDYCPAPTFSMRNGRVQASEMWVAPATGTVTTSPFARNTLNAFGIATFTVKGIKRQIHTSLYPIGNISVPSIQFDVEQGDTILFDLHAFGIDAESNQGTSFQGVEIEFSLDGGNPIRTQMGVWFDRPEEDIIFGPMYRNWGQFVYNGNRDKADEPIDESLLVVDEDLEDLAEGVEDVEDEDDLEGMPLNDGSTNPYVIMISEPKRGHWMGSDNLTFVKGDTVSSSRLGEDDLTAGFPVFIPGVTPAPNIQTEAISNGGALGGSAGPVSGAVGASWATTRNIVDISDFNGDQYPDIISDDKVQYTLMTGALEESITTHNLGNHIAQSQAEGFSIGGEFTDSDANSAGGTSGSGSNNSKSKVKATSTKSGGKASDGGEGAKASSGLGGGYTNDEDYAEESWIDVNGDGLVDKVYDDGRVRLNTGYSFLPAENWGFNSIWAGRTQEFGLGGGISLNGGSFQVGVSGSYAWTEVQSGLFDFNSDGLVDQIESVEPLRIKLNTGSGFGPVIDWDGVEYVNRGKASGVSANTAVTVCIPITFLGIGIKICANPSGAVMAGMSRQVDQVQDVDGDGFADVLYSDNDDVLRVKRSRIGKTNLLKHVSRPLGGTIDIDYALEGNDTNLPYAKWVMSSVVTNDGLAGDGVDMSVTQVFYNDGMHDRHEREFYGFGEVRIIDLDNNFASYRTTVREYSVQDYYTRGVLLSTRVESADGSEYDRVTYRYALLDPETGNELPPAFRSNAAGSAYVALVEVIERYAEGGSEFIEAQLTYSYDASGNVTKYIHKGNNAPENWLQIEYGYHDAADRYLKSIPSEFTVSNGNGDLLRSQQYKIDDNGNIVGKTVQLNASESGEYRYAYDEYGNMISETQPANYRGQQFERKYLYDDVLFTYRTQNADSYGLTEKYVNEPIYGLMTQFTDINQNTWEYEYDTRGRLIAERGPYEIADGIAYLRKYEYFPNAEVPYGVCSHFDPEYLEDIVTYSFYDGYGRQVQTKTPVAVFTGEGRENQLQMRVSGASEYDALGRLISQSYPVTETVGANNRNYNTSVSPIPPERFEYDINDRLVLQVHHNGTAESSTYSIGSDLEGRPSRVKTITSRLGRRTHLYTDTRDLTTGYTLEGQDGSTSVSLRYNGLSQLIGEIDNEGNMREIFYDLDGRKVREDDPDMGTTEYRYDGAGNMITKITQELRNTIPEGGEITYQYDHTRLTDIIYPKNYQNRVRFHYGEPEDKFNRAGRIWLIEDASGGEELFFGLTEEVVKSIRTVLLSETQMQTYIMEYAFDNWDRIKQITYADGEVLRYTYDRGGLLQTMHASKGQFDYPILEQVGYDVYGDEIYRKTGNGVTSDFGYDTETRNINSLSVALPDGSSLVDQKYRYNEADLLSSIDAAAVSAMASAPNSYSVDYDDLHRVAGARGQIQGSQVEEFEMLLQYNDLSNPTQYAVTETVDGVVDMEQSFDRQYQYEGLGPNAPSRIGGIKRAYDGNGNLVSAFGEATYTYQQFLWDEENRLQAVSDNGKISRYTYDAFGRRIIKSVGGYQGVFVNGGPVGFVQHTDDYTMYVNGLMSTSKRGYVKHYFTENSRVASKNGVGQFDHSFPSPGTITAGDLDYTKRARLLRQQAAKHFASVVRPPGPPTLPWYYAQPSVSGQAITVSDTIVGYALGTPAGWPGPIGRPDTTGPPGPPTWFDPQPERDSLSAGYNFRDNPGVVEVGQFFYHRDAYGNTNYVTNYLGDLRYQLEFTPTGHQVYRYDDGDEVRPNAYRDRDYDVENGHVYYEGYYYDPATTLFANPGYEDRYVGLSPYLNIVDGMSLDSSLLASNIRESVNISVKYAAQTGGGITANIGDASSNAFTGFGVTSITSNSGNDGDNGKKDDQKKQRPKANRTNVSPVDDPKDVQFKRRGRNKANTGKPGRKKQVKVALVKAKERRDIARKKRRATALARQKQVNRSFSFAPGDIGNTPGDRRGVRLGGAKYKAAQRKYQHRPGKVR